MSESAKILVIDDEEAICFAFHRYFENRGSQVVVAPSGREGLARFREWRPDVVFLDIRLPDGNGLDVLEQLRAEDAGACVIIITAYGSLETVTRAVRNKAFDYLFKPLDLDRAAELVGEALASRAAAADEAPRATEPPGEAQPLLIGSSPAMQHVYKQIGKVAQAAAAVLIHGATGTGKEVVARAIHEHSPRRDRPFVAVNCGALPENLVESELFGYVKGAFSGADADKPGRFEAANRGTLFLDEVGELPLAAQVKLLRFLDSQSIERLGSIRSLHLDVRVLAATNRDLHRAIESGAFRADLFYRLAVVQIELPPLGGRGEDVVELAKHFLAQRTASGRQPVRLHPDAAELLRRYPWPGNVRELRNAIEHASIVCGGRVVLPAHLPETIQSGQSAGDEGARLERMIQQYLDALTGSAGDLYRRAVEPVERALMLRILREADGNQSVAADRLGLHRNTLRKRLQQMGLEDEVAHE